MSILLEEKFGLIISEADLLSYLIFKELIYSCAFSYLLGFAQKVKRLFYSYHEDNGSIALIWGVHCFHL